MFFISDCACVATEAMVVADLRLDVQFDNENPSVSDDGFSPPPNLPSREAAPTASVGLNLEALPSQPGNLKEESREAGLMPFPRLLKTEPMPGVCTAWLSGF